MLKNIGKGFILCISHMGTMKDRIKYYMTYKGREERLEYDFMPEMLEIIEKPSNPMGKVIIILVFLLLTSAVIWALFFTIDIIVSERGYFVKNSEQNIEEPVEDDSELVLKINVKEENISDIEEGMAVNIKMNAYPYNKYGIYEGIVTKKSDVFVMDAAMNNYCSVYVELIDADNLEILEGMTAVCDFKVGKRTIMQYFLEPVTEGLENSFKEK